jgi:hypothetical protein
MSDSIRVIEKLVIRDAFDAEPSFVLRVIRIPGDLYDLSVFLVNQNATPGHATLANRPDDFLFHASPPGNNSGFHHMLFPRVFQCNLRLADREEKKTFRQSRRRRRLGWLNLVEERLRAGAVLGIG